MEKAVINLELTFAITAEEASSPAMKASLEEGFANALGLEPTAVRVTSIGGVAVTLRRLLTSTAVGFEISSNSDIDAEVSSQR